MIRGDLYVIAVLLAGPALKCIIVGSCDMTGIPVDELVTGKVSFLVS